jgi:hypothetical protein
MADQTPKVRESTELLLAGAGIGTLGAISAVVGAAVCPICVVATPALIGAGLYKRWKERRPTTSEPDGEAPAR